MLKGSLFRRGLHQSGRRVLYARDLLWELIVRDLKVRYKRSYLGIVWSFATPLFQIIILSFVFSRVIPLEIPHFTAFLAVGILAWICFTSGVSASATAVISNPEFIRRPGFPVPILPVLSVSSAFVNFMLAFPVLLAVVVLDGGTIGFALVALPLVFFLQFYLMLGLAYLISAGNVRFRDTQHLVTVLLMGAFFLTPIFYDRRVIPEEYSFIYDINPMAKLLTAYREIMIYNRIPETEDLLMVFVVASLIMAIGFSVFTRARTRFVEEL